MTNGEVLHYTLSWAGEQVVLFTTLWIQTDCSDWGIEADTIIQVQDMEREQVGINYV